MKKTVLAMMIMACYVSQINAQVDFGLKGGINYANFKFKDAGVDVSEATGWLAGALLQIKIPVIGVGVRPELLYTTFRGKVDNAPHSIHYLQVPVNVFKSFGLLVIRPYVQAGPYFSYAVHVDGKAFKDHIKEFDWGIGLGGGVQVWRLQLDARYSWGLQNVSSVKDFKMKNNVFSLSLGYLF